MPNLLGSCLGCNSKKHVSNHDNSDKSQNTAEAPISITHNPSFSGPKEESSGMHIGEENSTALPVTLEGIGLHEQGSSENQSDSSVMTDSGINTKNIVGNEDTADYESDAITQTDASMQSKSNGENSFTSKIESESTDKNTSSKTDTENDVKSKKLSDPCSDASNHSNGGSIMTVCSVSRIPSFAKHVVAHRGFHSKRQLPDRPLENTLGAFEYAWQNGVDMCECDVQLTKDNVLVIHHDASTLRLACAPDDKHASTDIDELTWEELQQIKLKDGSSVPSLEQVLEAAHRTDVDARLVVEVKGGDDEEMASKAAQVLFDLLYNNSDLCERVAVVMSFDVHVVKRFVFLAHEENFTADLKVMLLTENPDTESKDWVTNLNYATLATDEKFRKNILGVEGTDDRASLDGCYIRFRSQMLDGGEGEELFRRACKMCVIGVWMDATDPDTVDNTAKLIDCGAMFVNSDFARTRKFWKLVKHLILAGSKSSTR